ncbi:hypothetical protein H8A99_14035 [Bradyrhizobium sp. Arg68]|uniref:hypothetical protein n=1 Tax=Bradyrhizobium ivorense TaxID=2511166 RepID=UPI001E4F262D|nr:hypothetical protein [Bradyrhizobium ivorense]MCC8937561.1 hypothetical protein [Bradyrhizobium ivorense]
MNMFVSAAVTAATPAIAMTRADEAPVIDNEAVLARVEQIIDFLRTRYVREGWKMDEQGAALTLEYFRRRGSRPSIQG